MIYKNPDANDNFDSEWKQTLGFKQLCRAISIDDINCESVVICF